MRNFVSSIKLIVQNTGRGIPLIFALLTLSIIFISSSKGPTAYRNPTTEDLDQLAKNENIQASSQLFNTKNVLAAQTANIDLREYIVGSPGVTYSLTTGEDISYEGSAPGIVKMKKGSNYERFNFSGTSIYRIEDTSWAPLEGFGEVFCNDGSEAALTEVADSCITYSDNQTVSSSGFKWIPSANSKSVGETWDTDTYQLVAINENAVKSSGTYKACALSDDNGGQYLDCNQVSTLKFVDHYTPDSFTFCNGLDNQNELAVLEVISGPGTGDVFYYMKDFGLVGFEAPGFQAAITGPGSSDGDCDSSGSPGGADQCKPELEYCAENLIDGSFEFGEPYVQQDTSTLVPQGTWAWWQNNTGGDPYQCGEYLQDPEGNNKFVCAAPEVIVSSPGSVGGGQCSENLTSHGDNYLKIFTASGSMNGGLCFDVPTTFSGGEAGFDVKTKQDANPPYGKVDLYIGYSTTLGYQDVTGTNYGQIDWGNPTVVNQDEYTEESNFATKSIIRSIPAGAKSVCIRINNEKAKVGVNTFWDGGFLTNSAGTCSTSGTTSDGINRQGGGTCSCDEEGNPGNVGGHFDEDSELLYDYDVLVGARNGWNQKSCFSYPDNDNVIAPDGSIAFTLDLELCSDNNNPAFDCESEENYTAGYAWTGCVKEFPLLNYLSASKGTAENNFITDCELDTINNFARNGEYRSDGVLTINFTNKFPGAAQWIYGEDERQAFLKVPLLGTAAACAYYNPDDFQQNMQLSLELYDVRNDTSGYVVPEEDGSFIGYIINFLKEVFGGASITNGSDSNEVDVADVVPSEELEETGGVLCPSDHGDPIVKLNVSDVAEFDYADDGGVCEGIIEGGNYDLTKNEVCDTQFVYDREERETGEITGAECTLTEFNDFEFTETNFNKSLTNVGILEEVLVYPSPEPDNVCGAWNVVCNNERDFALHACDIQESYGNSQASWQYSQCLYNGGVYEGKPPNSNICNAWTVICAEPIPGATSFVETNCDTQRIFNGNPQGSASGEDRWKFEACQSLGGEYTGPPQGEPELVCQKTQRYENSDLCGLPVDCSQNVSQLYDACRFAQNDAVSEIQGDPKVKVKRKRLFTDFGIEGLGKSIQSAWLAERNSSPYYIKHQNVGIEITVCTSIYNLQDPSGTGGNGGPVSTILAERISETDIQEAPQFGVDLDNDPLYQQVNSFDLENPQNIAGRYMSVDAAPYSPTYSGGYDLVEVDNTGEDARVCFKHYFPYVGQIPRIYERLTYFLSNQTDTDPEEVYKRREKLGSSTTQETLASASSGGESQGEVKGLFDWVLEEERLEYLLIPYLKQDEELSTTDCGRANCDHFAPAGVPYFDPMADYLIDENLLPPDYMDPGDIPHCVGNPGGTTPTPTPSVSTPPGGGNCGDLPNIMEEDIIKPHGGGAGGTDTYSYAHPGLDFGLPVGTDIYAAADGEVIFVRNANINDSQWFGMSTTPSGSIPAGTLKCYDSANLSPLNGGCDWYFMPHGYGLGSWWAQYGNMVAIKHGDRVTVYAHLKTGGVYVQEGDCVTQGDKIAESSGTGNSTGPHLHFEVRQFNCSAYNSDCTDDPGPLINGTGDGNGTGDIPIPPGDVPDGLPLCDPEGSEGSQTAESLKCLIRIGVDAVNDEFGFRITEEMVYAIGLQESKWDCTERWEDWPSGVECTGDPNQIALITDNLANDTNKNGVIDGEEFSIRGITQFYDASFNTAASDPMMETCTQAMGVDYSVSPDPGSNSQYSRHRVGDMICATIIKASNDAKTINGGNWVDSPEGYSDYLIYNVAKKYAGGSWSPEIPVQEECFSGFHRYYCRNVLNYYRGNESTFNDLVCTDDGDPEPSDPPEQTFDNTMTPSPDSLSFDLWKYYFKNKS